jgi:hypothetical protein
MGWAIYMRNIDQFNYVKDEIYERIRQLRQQGNNDNAYNDSAVLTPTNFAVHNYPNPFNPATTILFTVGCPPSEQLPPYPPSERWVALTPLSEGGQGEGFHYSKQR